MKPMPPSIDQTLTRSERAAPFHVDEPPYEPLVGRTRINGAIEGDEFVEIDPVSGAELAREKLLSA